MEDSEPICETEPASFCVELLKRLNTQRGQGYLCDITLVAKEGNEFKAHRNVLSAASPFFAKLLQSEMKEKEEGVIRLEEISPSIMEEILEFVYTGHIEIDDEGKAKDLIIAADYLLLLCLKTIATRYLEERLTILNCVSTFYVAEKYQCHELAAKSRALILDNFASVAGFDEFLNLEAEEVGSWISSDEICVAAEEDVLKIIEKWIEQNEIDRKAKFEELFRHVRPVFLSRDSLLDVVTHNLVRENHSCLEKVLDAIAIVNGASADDIMQSPRRSLGTEAIVVGGKKHTLCYLPQRDEWKFLANSQNEKDFFTQMITFRDQLFTFYRGNVPERYDPVLDSWSPLQHMQLSSFSKQVAVVRGQIYAIDVDKDRNESTIKRYNVKSWSWESILTSHEGCRYGSCVVPAGNCIYILCGVPVRSIDGCVTKADRFDTEKNKWEQISDMQEAREDAFGVATQGKIFVAGGGISSSYDANISQTCEVYSISTNEWQFIASVNVKRYWGSMVCVNGTLYVLGGCDQSLTPKYSVESYDPTVKKWTLKTCIPVDKIPGQSSLTSFKGCAMKVPRAVLDKPSISIQRD